MLSKKLNIKYVIGLLVLSSMMLFLHHLNQRGFFMDGLIYAAISKNMALTGTYFKPFISDSYYQTFHDHVPFMLILQGLFFKVFGIGFWQARLFINLFSFSIFWSVLYYVYKSSNRSQMIFSALLIFLTLPFLKHGRHPNFDLPLALTVFLSINFYFEAFKENNYKWWLLTGIFFGLSMLFKGPMAIFIPLTIVLHLLLSRKLERLIDFRPWFGLLLGFIIFSLWPLSLYLTDNFDIFLKWFKFTILDSALGSRGVVKTNYFFYLLYLLTFVPLHILFLSFSLYQKEVRENERFFVNFILVIVILLFTSVMKFKLSHYVMCIYPPLVLCASFAFKEFKLRRLENYILIFIIAGSFINFIIPQNPKKDRDVEIFEINAIVKEKNYDVQKYYVLDDAYPYWSMASLLSFIDSKNVYQKLDENNYSKSVVISFQDFSSRKCLLLYRLEKYNSNAFYCP